LVAASITPMFLSANEIQMLCTRTSSRASSLA